MNILNSKILEKENTIPILIFHGLFGMLDNWGTLGRKFSENNEVHLMDLRNHGRSFHSDEMSYETMSDDIVNYMNYHDIKEAILLGHSLGGKAVMECSIKKPELVNKLIVVDMAPKAYPSHHQAVIKALESIDFDNIKDRKEVEDILVLYLKDKSVVQFLMKSLYWTENKKLNFRFNLKILTEKYNQIINRMLSFGVFNKPTLFIAGEKSNYILPQDSFSIKQMFPQSDIKIIKNAAHWVQADNPEDFYNLVSSFIA